MLLHSLQTPAVERAQKAAYGRARSLPPPTGSNQPLGSDEVAFISARDSFYLASVGETGWPYVQHRGGPRGFLGVIDASHLAFADYPGNRQLITTGNVSTTDRVSLFLMNYAARERLKIIGHAHIHSPDDVPNIVPHLLAPPNKRIECVFVIEVVGFDWNCPQYITPRFTAEEVAEVTQPLQDRIIELEARLATEGD